MLGIPTVVDRVIQQAIAQELTPIFEEQFSENSFGFRPRRSQHNALKASQKNANEGYVYTVSLDLEKFFDVVNHSKLIEILSRTIKDGRVISLIHKYLNAGVLDKGVFAKTEDGFPQGNLCRVKSVFPYKSKVFGKLSQHNIATGICICYSVIIK